MRFFSYIVRCLTLLGILISASRAHAGDQSLCCPSDLDGDGSVVAADLGILLGAWGPVSEEHAADLDGSGAVDASDLAVLLGAWGVCPAPCLKTLVVGTVELVDGTPVSQAVLVTELGGNGVSGPDGTFSFEVEVGPRANTLNVTAVASIRGVTYTGTKLVSPIALDGVTDAGAIVVSAEAGCSGEFGWLPGFGLPGMNGIVYALTVFDDGSGGGPALYAGGQFTMASGVTVNKIAKWNGTSWSSVGTGSTNGVNNTVLALTVFDDGSGGGPALYSGGEFTAAGGVPANRIAKWNGVSWSSLGTGSANGVGGAGAMVHALTVYDDGSGGGPALYAGGFFTTAGGAPANFIAKWNGTSWSSLGTGSANGVFGPLPYVYALTVFDDGSGGGPALYVGGSFTTAGGLPANRIAKWNGVSWSPLTAGSTNGVNNWVRVLTVFDDGLGGGPALHVGGKFTMAGDVVAKGIARWNGVSWSPLGTGSANGMNSTVLAATVFDDGSGSGPALYAGGIFTTAGGVTANQMARWNGTSWSSLETGSANGMSGGVLEMTVFDDGSGSGPALVAAGDFTTAGGAAANRIATWNGTSWSSLGTGSANGMNSAVLAATVFDDGSGSGPALYAGGLFTTAGGAPANFIAKWNGTSWSSLGTGSANGVSSAVRTLTVFDDGSGPALYAGGDFTTAGGVPANRIAKWNGTSWSSLGTGSANGVNGFVYALTVFDDGSGGGPALYAGGAFTTAGGATATRIAKWNGTSWSSLGTGSANGVSGNAAPSVSALAVFDDGSGGGPALYAGGEFTKAGGLTANRIAKWNGTSWSSLGSGSANGVNNAVLALTVFDDGLGGGPALHAGGLFTTAGGGTANRIAKWNGTSWSSVGTGSANGVGGAFPYVFALTRFDDGSGRGAALYAGGEFTTAGGVSSNYVAKWGCVTTDNDAPAQR